MHQCIETKLSRFANSRCGDAFQWGICDCNTLALEALDLIAGTQLAFEVIGQYANREDAVAFYGSYRFCWGTWEGWESVGRNYLQTGDFIIADDGDFCMPYVVVGGRALSSFEGHGVRTCRVEAVLKLHDNAECFRPPCRGVE